MKEITKVDAFGDLQMSADPVIRGLKQQPMVAGDSGPFVFVKNLSNGLAHVKFNDVSYYILDMMKNDGTDHIYFLFTEAWPDKALADHVPVSSLFSKVQLELHETFGKLYHKWKYEDEKFDNLDGQLS